MSSITELKAEGTPIPLGANGPVKACFDYLAAALLLILFAPVLLVVAILVRVKLGSPVIFKQTRPGRNAQPFQIFKFRTMKVGHESDEDRLTKLGKILRATSLDELPELINVLRGEMSLVGPRPLLTKYLDLYTPEQARRHEVKPGITGWAQVNGRNQVGWDDRFRLDTWYIDHWSFLLDLKILFMTVAKVFRREGVSAANHVTMPEFSGRSE